MVGGLVAGKRLQAGSKPTSGLDPPLKGLRIYEFQSLYVIIPSGTGGGLVLG